MTKKLILNGDLPLLVNFNDKAKVKKLKAVPHYEDGKWKCWLAPKGVDVMPFKEFWNPEFKAYYKSLNPDIEEAAPEGKRLSVLLREVKAKLEKSMPDSYWIHAEIVNISGGVHKYLEIADYDDGGKELAKIRANIFSSHSGIIKGFESETGMKLASGMKVLLKVSVSFHEAFGISLNVSDIDSRFTLGDMEAKLSKIRKTLLEQGIIDSNKCLVEPYDFTRIAVIAPEAAAGLGDFKTTSDKLERAGLCSFDYFKAVFQGKSALTSVLNAMVQVDSLVKSDIKYDALVIIRGGGDKSGLYALNELELARMVCTMQIPVMVGIGHERDTTILDEVAKLRFATPSLVVSHIANSITHNAMNAKQDLLLIKRLADSSISEAFSSLEQMNASIRESSRSQIEKAKSSIDFEKQSMVASSQIQLEKARHETKEQVSMLVFQDPMKVVDKGYAIVRNTEGKVVGNISDLRSGENIKVSLRDGDISAEIIKTSNKSISNE